MIAGGLTARELGHLAVLRVTALAAGGDVERLTVRRADLAVLLAAVDRLSQAPRAESATLVRNLRADAAYFAGTTIVYGHGSGPSQEDLREPRP